MTAARVACVGREVSAVCLIGRTPAHATCLDEAELLSVSVLFCSSPQRMQSGHVQLHSCLFQLGAVHAACPPALCQRSATVSAQQVWSGRRARRPRYTIAAKRSLTTARGSVPRLGLISTQEFRRNVGICLVNKEGLVFAARLVFHCDRQ